MPNSTAEDKSQATAFLREKTPAWVALVNHQKQTEESSISSFFDKNDKRFEMLSTSCDVLFLDYSKHQITPETIDLLCNLARACDLERWRDDMFSGARVNTTEGRSVLHTALRSDEETPVTTFKDTLMAQIETVSKAVRSNPNITDIVNLGVGGSELAPRLVYDALKHTPHKQKIHYVSNMDAADIESTFKKLTAPENTVFVISSKSFSTAETIMNAKTARDWFGNRDMSDHFIAVTTNTEEAQKFGIAPHNILPMQNWIGGRYSVWSGIGLSIAIAFGFETFKDLLGGAHVMDNHFKTAPLEKNMPVIMAMLGVWYRNFWDYHTHAILPYTQALYGLPRYIQQLDMESNGKTYDRDGRRTPYHTSPIIFGEPGTNGQHAFFQLLHQGKDIIPADFIGIINPDHAHKTHQKKLLANMLAQSEALMNGQTNTTDVHKHFEGNRPSSCLLMDRLDAHSLGMLLALYEHKVFVQGIIWNINSFDQWGVELGKTIAGKVESAIDHPNRSHDLSSSTTGLLQRIKLNQSEH